MEAPVQFRELALKSGLTKLLRGLNALSGATPPQRCSLAEHLLLTACTKNAQNRNGLVEVLKAAVLSTAGGRHSGLRPHTG